MVPLTTNKFNISPEFSMQRKFLVLMVIALAMLPLLQAAGALEKPLSRIYASSLFRTPQSEERFPTAFGQASVVIEAANGQTVSYMSNNGADRGQERSMERDIPRMVLLNNGKLTDPMERTLRIVLTGLEVPVLGFSIHLEVETQLGDPDVGGGAFNRIKVWEIEREYQQSDSTQEMAFEYTFGQNLSLNSAQSETTPTGYYRVHITISENSPSETSGPSNRAESVVEVDYAFLLENQWVAPLASGSAVPEAGPQELVVFYNDMTPYQTDTYQPGNRLERKNINRYIGNVIVPAMLEIIHLETETWGVDWDPAWQGHRGGQWSRSLTVALTDDGIWYHGKAPKGGYATISINVHQMDLKTYSDLTDWILSIFGHELFHNLQRSQHMQAGGRGSIEGQSGTWELVTEGTALLVETFVREEYGFADGPQGNPYSLRDRRFQDLGVVKPGELGTYLLTVSPYDVVVYWRFVSSQYASTRSQEGGVTENLQFIRHTLEILYTSPDLLSAGPDQLPTVFPQLMDRAFASQPQSPFSDYASSLASFARFLALSE